MGVSENPVRVHPHLVVTRLNGVELLDIVTFPCPDFCWIQNNPQRLKQKSILTVLVETALEMTVVVRPCAEGFQVLTPPSVHRADGPPDVVDVRHGVLDGIHPWLMVWERIHATSPEKPV